MVAEQIQMLPPDVVDHKTFMELLEMDEDDDDFSKSLVEDYIAQAEETFVRMRSALTNMDYSSLSKLGHFLKGSSAALGLILVRDACERLQYLGRAKGSPLPQPPYEADPSLKTLVDNIICEYERAVVLLKRFYNL